VGDNLASMAGGLHLVRAAQAIQKLFFHTPWSTYSWRQRGLPRYYRWPVKDKKTFENWKRDTSWGRLFQQYENV